MSTPDRSIVPDLEIGIEAIVDVIPGSLNPMYLEF